jgi:hypothetical protein
VIDTAEKTDLRIKVDGDSADLKKRVGLWYHLEVRLGEKQDNNEIESRHPGKATRSPQSERRC